MPQRYSITNRKSSEGPSKLQKPGKAKLHTASAPTSSLPLIIGAVAIVVISNIATFVLTFGVMQSQIVKLQNENKKLIAEIDNYKKTYGPTQVQPSGDTKKNNAPTTNIPVPKSTADSLKKATEDKSSAELRPILATAVTVSIAGSTTTTQPADQAANTLSFLIDSKGPWNWNPTPQQLDQLRSGPYAQYFGDNTLIGISSNGYVISYTVNSSGLVTSIFLSPTILDSTGGEGSE